MAITKRATHPPSLRNTRADLALTPAWTYTLMSGELPTERIAGWVEQARDDYVRTADGSYDYTAHGDRLWLQHGADLTREAAVNSFEPFWTSKYTPTGPGFEQWLAAFINEHRY